MLSASKVSFSRWGAIQIYLPLPLPLSGLCYVLMSDDQIAVCRFQSLWLQCNVHDTELFVQ